MSVRYFLFFALSLLVEYGPEWAPYYAAGISGGAIRVAGRLSEYRFDCPTPPKPGAVGRCTDRYLIPRQAIPDFTTGNSLGLGILVYASAIGCVGQAPSVTIGDLESPGRDYDVGSTYQVLRSEQLLCAGDLQIDIWSPYSYRRHGLTAAPIVVGDPNVVTRTKKLIEFFVSQLPIMLGALLIGVVGFTWALKPVGGSQALPMAFERMSWAWILFALFSTGLAQTLIPLVPKGLILGRISNSLHILAYLGSGALLLSYANRLPTWFRRGIGSLSLPLSESLPIPPLVPLVVLYGCMPFFGVGLAPVTAVQAIVYISASLFQRSAVLFYFGAALALDTCRFYNMSFTPHHHLGLIFLLLTLGNSLLERIKSGSRWMEAIRWSREAVAIPGNDPERKLEALLHELGRYFGIERITLIDAGTNGTWNLLASNLTGEGGQRIERFELRSIPPVFSKIYENKQPIWNSRAESAERSSDGPRKPSPRYSALSVHDYFSILPIFHEGVQIGAIALTGYSEEKALNENHHIALQTSLEMLLPFMAGLLSRRRDEHERKQLANALAGFVPKEVYSRIMNRTEIREQEEGYLLLLDLRDSTMLCRKIGQEAWKEMISSLAGDLEKLALEHGYVLQSIVWDAFCFTRAARAQAEEVEMAEVFSQAMRQMLAGRKPVPEITLEARFCLTYGDTSRDLSGGIHKQWTIVGHAMADASKLEQVAKKLEGALFGLESIFGSSPMPASWRTSAVSFIGSERLIVRGHDESLHKKRCAG